MFFRSRFLFLPAMALLSSFCVSRVFAQAPTPGSAEIDAASALPKSAVDLVTSSFTPNATVTVEATGKPLSMTGSWGVQVKFPQGQPQACAAARVPCVNVVYHVPENKVICVWTVGFVNAVEPQADGTIKHAHHAVVIDENDEAARYTLKSRWAKGDPFPELVEAQKVEYPAIAASAGVGGVVTVRIIVGPNGTVTNATAIDGPALLRPPVVDAVKHWKFDPLAIGKSPTSFRLDREISFNMPGPKLGGGYREGVVRQQNNDPHDEPGFRDDGASNGRWESCTAVSCNTAPPPTPK